MLPRVLEPEVMDTADEARDYDAMDHVAVNTRFCTDVLGAAALTGRVLDVGTGTARIPIELCALATGITIVGIDLADHMLALGRVNVARAGLEERVTLQKIDAKAMPYEDESFDACISNSIVHHIPEPGAAFREMWRVTRSGGLLFVRDLARPASMEVVDALMARDYAKALPGFELDARALENQRDLFRASLLAALTVDEVAALVAPLGIAPSAVSLTSDRHWTLAVRKP